VLVSYDENVVLCTVVARDEPNEGQDFFPLSVDYREKSASGGKIPGGFFKREGRPTEKEVLTSRLIDRPMRPLFPKGFHNETQGIANVLSYGDENIADILGIIAVSAALHISDVPFNGPVGAEGSEEFPVPLSSILISENSRNVTATLLLPGRTMPLSWSKAARRR